MGKKIKFSVVMPIYNREKYLKEAIDSIVKQTYGFKNIELILVDDGSTDESGNICDEYQKLFPNNCKVIHQENQGASAARKAGVELATGEWVNFLDSDDKLEKNAFKEVVKFINRYNNQTDVIAIPVYYFGDRKGQHILNNKFRSKTRIIDLDVEWNYPQLFINSTFIRTETAKEVAFKDESKLVTNEDARELLRVLLEKKTLGVLSTTKYWYRRHNNTLVNNAKLDKRWYTFSLKHFTLDILNYAKEKCGIVPKFVQYTLMYELQWRFKQKTLDGIPLSADEISEYRDLLLSICSKIDADVILCQRNLWREYKYYLLKDRENDQVGFDIEEYILSRTAVKLLFAEIQNDNLRIEGWIPRFYSSENKYIELYVDIDGEKTKLNLESIYAGEHFLGDSLYNQGTFLAEIPLCNNNIHIISFYIKTENNFYCLSHLDIGQFVPLDPFCENSYKKFQNLIMKKDLNKLVLSRKRFVLIYEIKYLWELLKKKKAGSTKAFFVRCIYGLISIFPHKKIWLISDRVMKAGDNGEALFQYVAQNKINNLNVYFVISKKSEDYKRLKNIGLVVDSFSIKHRLLYLLSDYNISSHADKFVQIPFHGYEYAYRSLNMPRFVFLQHGVTQNDISSWLKKYNKNIFGFITTTNQEYQSIIKKNYGYTEKQVWLTGFCRYDNLENNPQNIVVIAPTWRKDLVYEADRYTGLRNIREEFIESNYFDFYNKLINDERLINYLRNQGFYLKFVPHPVMIPFINLFGHHSDVKFAKATDSYRDIFSESKLFVTDYSSTAFDFAYLKKPVIYCQFDKDDFYGGKHIVQQGYFDYERDGFGEVEYTLEDTVNRIIEYVENDCKLKPEYEKRIDNTFAFHDRNNCKRVYDKLIEMRDK